MKKYLLSVTISMLMSVTSMAGKVNTILDMRFNYSLERPGVNAMLTRKLAVSPSPKDPVPVFYVNGDKTLALLQPDNSYFVYINSMQRWSVNHPVVYSVMVREGKEQLTRQFGIHDMEVRGGMIGINDSTILHKGLTEEALPFASMKSQKDWCTYLQEIKSRGFTVISVGRERMSRELMTAADICGIMVHARVMPVNNAVVNVKKKKDKKNKKQPETVVSLEEEFIEHPSLCMATFMGGMSTERSDKYLPAVVFDLSQDSLAYANDDVESAALANICIADFSGISDEGTLSQCLERTLYTKGIGILLFSSIEQSMAWEDIMLLGRFDRDEWDSSMSMSMDLYFANNSDEYIRNASFGWKYYDESEFTFASGSRHGLTLHPHAVDHVLLAFTPLADIYPDEKVTLKVWMEGTGYERSWTHTIHFPAHILRMNEELHRRMKNWCRRNAEETDEEYEIRVNDVTKARQKRILAYDIVTQEAGEMYDENGIHLSAYNRADNTVVVTAGNVPAFRLRVPQQDADDFLNEEELELRRTRYGLTNKDKVVLAYAEVHNRRSDVTFTYENDDLEANLNRILVDDRLVPAELKELAAREDSVLQEIKKHIIQNAMQNNLITKGTKINVNTRYITDYDEKGEPLNNYEILFEYHVDDLHSQSEDFAPGRYRIEDSHAAMSMLQIITSAFEQEFARYIVPGKKLNISITGSADSSPIRHAIAYDGCYGEFRDELYFLSSEKNMITVTTGEGIMQNEQLAYMRGRGVRDFLEHNLTAAPLGMNVRYLHDIELPKGQGGKFRRIKVRFTFIDVSHNQ